MISGCQTQRLKPKRPLIDALESMKLSTQKRWYRLRGYQLLADFTKGVQFKDGIRVEQDAAWRLIYQI